MSLFSRTTKKRTSIFSKGAGIVSGGGKERTTIDISSIDLLKEEAERRGLDVKEKKPSLFRRAIDFISRPLYASAGAAKAIVKGENVLGELWKGLRGQEKETYSDVLGEMGVENKWVKGIVGFALDVALDPITYFGGTAIKFGAKGVGAVARPVGRLAAKASPQSALHLADAATSLKDAFGAAFKFGHKTTKGLADDVGRAINKMGIAKEEIIEGNVKLFGKKFAKEELEEAGELMIKNRRLELKARTGASVKYLTSKNEKVNTLLTAFKGKAKDIAKKAGIPESKAYENYIPFLRLDKLKPIEQAAGVLKVGQEGYYKQFRNLIKDENLLKKPIEAYSRREFQVVRDKITRSTIDDMVKTYGKGVKAFASADDAAKEGYKLIKDKQFGKAIGFLKEPDASFIDNYLFPEFKTIDVLAKASGYDAFTRWFKTWVTAYFPAFHVRNYISGNVQNYQRIGAQALNPKNHNVALGILKNKNVNVKLGKQLYNLQDLNKVMKENFRGASRYISDIGDYIDDIVGNKFRIKKISKARNIGNFVEMNQKAVAMTGALRQGKTLKNAIKIAEEAGFDYSKITKFESKIMRRAVPFYTFARKNAELQAKTFIKHPERIINQSKLATALGTIFGEKMSEEDLKGVPPWALEGLGFKVEGNKYFTKFGLPLEEFIERINDPLKTTLSSLNPIIKFPLESKMGYDFFRESKITDIDKVAPASGELLIKAKEKGLMPEWLDQTLNVRSYVSTYDGKTKYVMSPKVLHLVRNIPTSRFQNTLEKIFDGDMDKVSKWLAFFSGARIYDIDIEQQKYFEERDLRRDIEDQLLQRGIGQQFESFYIKKD